MYPWWGTPPHNLLTSHLYGPGTYLSLQLWVHFSDDGVNVSLPHQPLSSLRGRSFHFWLRIMALKPANSHSSIHFNWRKGRTNDWQNTKWMNERIRAVPGGDPKTHHAGTDAVNGQVSSTSQWESRGVQLWYQEWPPEHTHTHSHMLNHKSQVQGPIGAEALLRTPVVILPVCVDTTLDALALKPLVPQQVVIHVWFSQHLWNRREGGRTQTLKRMT